MSTLDIIAREVGVSARTVSNVLNGKNKENWGSTALRAAKIREVAERVGYQPNVMARAVATGRSRVIGVAVRADGGGNDAVIQNGLLEELTAQDYTTKLLHLPSSPTSEHFVQVAQQCAMWKLEGLIALTVDDVDMPVLQEQLDRISCPVAFVGGIPPEGCLGVYSDSLTAVRLGVQHLVDLGHRHIAFLGGDRGSLVTLREAESFRRVMGELDLPLGKESIAFSDWADAHVMAEGATRLLEQSPIPTALFCNSSSQALIAIATARRRGLQVPQQLSVICYSEAKLCAYTDPALTALVQPSKQMGHIVVQQLLARIESQGDDTRRQPLRLKEGIRLVIRGSTAAPAPAATP